VVPSIDVDVTTHHGKEQKDSVASWEKEDHDAKHNVEKNITITAHLHRCAHNPIFRIDTLDLFVTTHKELPEPEG
jgi:hypothetical protein